MQLYLKTYGCQMNVYDSERMVDILRPLGFSLTDDPLNADVAIVNSCHVRENPEQKLLSDLGRLKIVKDQRQKSGKNLIIVAAGCTAQAHGNELIKNAPYVSLVVGTQSYHTLGDLLGKILDGEIKSSVAVDFPEENKFEHLPRPFQSKVCAYLAVQEGCSRYCHFCSVPFNRGSEYSRDVASVLNEAKHLVSLGAKEITLLGQNVNAYHGLDNKREVSLAELIHRLAEIDGLKRIRYTTSHPWDMTDDLMQAHRDVSILMPFLHLPIQSGSNAILKAMNRKHDRDFYLNIVEKLKQYRSDIALSSDFIVGYPGESEKDFLDTLDLIDKVQYHQAYSFMYSPRPGTVAAESPNQVAKHVQEERLQILQEKLRQQQIEFNKSYIGKELNVILDRIGKHQGQFLGRSEYMHSVVVTTTKFAEELRVKIVDATQNSLRAELVDAPSRV